MTTLLKCLACNTLVELGEGRNTCPCGRSAASTDDSVVELQGPARVLFPADDITTVDGVPWVPMPEAPLVVRRAVVAPLL